MTLDTRHWGWCSLGPLAPRSPATIADSYVQGGGGIVSTRGTVTLAGIYRPAVGTPVSLAISDGQRWIARVPRRLRVLSSLADPLRGITTVSVGCLFALYENRKPPESTLKEAEQNASVPDAVRRVAALPITAAWVTQRILTALGLTAAGAIPFGIARVVDEWDLSAGYVEELGRIAQSERYRCWINGAEQVAFIPLDQEIAAGPLLTRAELIDLQPVNVGDLPGEAVFAKYSSLKLVPPDPNLSEREVSRRNWERERVIGGGVQSIHSYTNAAGQTVKEFITYNDASETVTTYDGGDRVIRRVETSNQLNGTRRSETTFRYASGFTNRESEDYSRVLEESTTEWTPTGDIAAACGKNGPHADFRGGNRVTSWRVTQYEKERASGITLTKTVAATAYLNTPFGSDAISKLREAGEPLEDLIGYASRLTPYGSSTRIRTEREYGLQKRPGQQERNRAALERVPTVEQTAQTTWALGSPASEAAVELSPPYVSDDRITAAGTPPVYSVVPSGAEQQALGYARVENRLLLAHRNGVGLQLLPIDLPAEPFGLFYLRLNGCTAAFRVNGATWTIGSDGAVCGCDALFWGAIDGTAGAAWFPLPPGVSALPDAVAVTTNASPLPPNAISIPGGFNPVAPDLTALFASLPTTTAPTPRATVDPAVLVRPWSETVSLRGGVRIGAGFRVQQWLPTTVSLGGGVRVGGVIRLSSLRITAAEVVITPQPLTAVKAFEAQVRPAAIIAAGQPLAQRLTAGTLTGTPLAAGVTSGVVEVAGLPLEASLTAGPITGTPIAAGVTAGKATMDVGALGAETGAGPITGTPIAAEVTAGHAVIAGLPLEAAEGSGGGEVPYWAETELLLPMSGANNSTVFTDLSSFARTVQVFGDTKISTALGDPAAIFDGTGDYLEIDVTTPGTGDFTLEAYVRPFQVSGVNNRAIMSFGLGLYAGTLYQVNDGVCFEQEGGQACAIAGLEAGDAALQHVAASMISGVLRVFLNGVPSATTATNDDNYDTGILRIGRPGTDGEYFGGYVRWARYTRAGRYSGAFTPPPPPFPTP